MKTLVLAAIVDSLASSPPLVVSVEVWALPFDPPVISLPTLFPKVYFLAF